MWFKKTVCIALNNSHWLKSRKIMRYKLFFKVTLEGMTSKINI